MNHRIQQVHGGEVNLGREKQRRTGSRFCVRREDGDGGGGQKWEKHTPPKKTAGKKVEKWKQLQGLNQKGRKERV